VVWFDLVWTRPFLPLSSNEIKSNVKMYKG
jgi:hypothetical protein